MNKPTVVIQEWSLHFSPLGPYQAPETQSQFLTGKAYGHSRFEDGKFIHTSEVIRFFDDNEKVETLNTVYILGQKSKDYELFLNNYNAEV